MAAETDPISFKWDDETIELVDITDLDMDEWEILYDYAQLVLSDFAPVEVELKDERQRREAEAKEEARQRRVEQPKFWRAMFHISYRRAHPDADEEALREFARGVKLTSALASMNEIDGEGEESAPLALTSTPDASSSRSSDALSESTPNDSTTSSDEPDAQPAPIGITG